MAGVRTEKAAVHFAPENEAAEEDNRDEEAVGGTTRTAGIFEGEIEIDKTTSPIDAVFDCKMNAKPSVNEANVVNFLCVCSTLVYMDRKEVRNMDPVLNENLER